MNPLRPLGPWPFVFLVPVLASSAALAAPTVVQPRGTIAPQHEQVRWGPEVAGESWARGADYKAGFDASGAQFVPFLGSHAPRNFPLAFRAKGARCGAAPIEACSEVEPQRTGDTVEFARGGFVERYELAPHALEQSFVFESLPARGELVLELGIEGELAPRADDDGIVFANDLGGARYGRATAIDAHGARCEAPLELVAGGLAIRVPAAFVEQAALPLTIDPLVASFTLTTGLLDDFAPDACFDATSSQYVIAWEETFSATDHDVYVALLNSSGSQVDANVIDSSTANWVHPRIANLDAANRCLVVAAVGPNGGLQEIRGCLVDISAILLAPHASFQISGSATESRIAPDVGGDPAASGSTRFCVVWELVHSASNHDIQAQLVDANGGLVLPNAQVFSSSVALDEAPSISRSCAGSGQWHVAWQRLIATGNHDIIGASISTAGVVTASNLNVHPGTTDDTRPCVSSETSSGYWMVLCERLSGTTHDIQARAMIGSLLSAGANLSQLEEQLTPGVQAADQVQPCVDSDGERFVYAYSEPVNGSTINTEVYCGTLDLLGTVPTALYVAEARLPVASSGLAEAAPRVCSRASCGGPLGGEIVVEQQEGASLALGEIRGALYAAAEFTPFCHPGFNAAAACPCANPPASFGRGCDNSSATGGALLGGSGAASLAADGMQFTTTGEKPTATSVVLQGSATASTVFGMGVRCVGGTLKRLYTKTAVAGSISAPGAGDPSVSARSAALGDPLVAGLERYYFVYYRDPIVLGGCPATSTFNTTNAGALHWRP